MAEPPAGQPKPIEPPAGQPVSGGYHGPMTDQQKGDICQRLAEMFPDIDPADYWPKGATGTPYQRNPETPPAFPGGEPAEPATP